MKALKIGTTASQAAGTPFAPGWPVVAMVFGAGKIQGSADGTTYTDIVTGTADDLTVQGFAMPAYIKTTAGNAFLIGGA